MANIVFKAGVAELSDSQGGSSDLSGAAGSPFFVCHLRLSLLRVWAAPGSADTSALLMTARSCSSTSLLTLIVLCLLVDETKPFSLRGRCNTAVGQAALCSCRAETAHLCPADGPTFVQLSPWPVCKADGPMAAGEIGPQCRQAVALIAAV